MRREDALELILETKVVAVLRLADAAKVRRVGEAIAAGGVRALEVTMTTPGAVALVREMAADRTPGLLVGAGTVLDEAAAEAVIGAGADFVVSPILREGIVLVCRRSGVVAIPGALTPTEIVSAWELGADIVKVFPATSGGPRYIKDLRGPFPDIRLMPTGGVDAGNARAFLDAGACAVAVGTSLLDPAAIAAGDWGELTRRARALVAALGADR